MRRVFISAFVFALSFLMGAALDFGSAAYAQMQDKDSLVRLVDAKAAQLTERDGQPYRIVKGPARFLHNNTYLLCDSAVWNVNSNVIDAIGHVQIIQQDTYLVGDKLTYLSDENLAQFRGEIVRLYNKKGDQLKTRYLDYYTADSTAVFYNGGAMRSKDGQIIEGMNGRYESATNCFTFEVDVEMFADSMFVVSNRAVYNSAANRAYFYDDITAWKGRDTVFSNRAAYDNATSCLTLQQDNYVATENQQIWADSIKYFRTDGVVQMFDNVQLQDDTQQIFLLGDEGSYHPSPMVAVLTKQPVAAMWSEQQVRTPIRDTSGAILRDTIEIKRDTLFTRGDTLKLWQVPMYQVDSSEIANAQERLKMMGLDPMQDIHAENKKYLDAYHKNKELLGKPRDPGIAAKNEEAEVEVAVEEPPVDKALREGYDPDDVVPRDSLQATPLDTAAIAPIDSTMVTFMAMYHNVKMYRNDIAGRCDSLIYTSIDSIARFYKDPILWSDQKNQFTSDSLQIALRNNAVYKANFIENAMIVSKEDSIHFDQIKSVEMVAYFNNNDITRFDALGGVQAMLFFAERDTTITLMNQKECKLLSAKIVNREIQRVQYVGDIKSDMIPTYKLPVEKMRLRGFSWREELMPKDREEITSRTVKPSKRGDLKKIRFPMYMQTDIYFPEDRKLMNNLKNSIDGKIALENKQREERRIAEEQRKQQEAEEAEKENLRKEMENTKEGVEVLDDKSSED